MAKTASDQDKDTSAKTPLVSIYNEKPDLRKKEQPLVQLKVTNPITYLKKWWKRIIGNEGIDFRFRIRPLTAIAIAFVIASIGFGVGRISLPFRIPFFESIPAPTPTATPDPWRDTAFSGTLRFSITNNRYYLITASAEAINLDVPDNIDLSQLVSQRIFATGKYNQLTRTLNVTEASDLEILPLKIIPLPTLEPSPTPEEKEVTPAAQKI